MQPIIRSYDDNPVYVETAQQLKRAGRLPDGFFSVGIILPTAWKPEVLAWDLNSLFGGTFAEEAFRADSGARNFSFCGERAGEAHELCDALRDGWFRRADSDETIVLTMGDEGDSLEDLIDSVLLISPASSYIEDRKYSLFLVPDEASAAIVQDALRRERRPAP